MEIKVLVFNKLDLSKLKSDYTKYIEFKNNKYLVFYAKKKGVIIEAYTSGKVVIKGKIVDDEINELQKKYKFSINDSATKKNIKRNDIVDIESSIGSDEVGTGDVFGPIVVCSFYLPKHKIENLKLLGVKDSKDLNDEMICKIAKQIIKDKYIYSLLILGNEKFNDLTKKGLNMNVLKAKLHNQAIINVLKKSEKKVSVILDQFCEPDKYFSYLEKDSKVYRDIIFQTKAESYYLSVAAASIIARYTFLIEMDKLSEKVGLTLRKGASNLVDNQLEEIIKSKNFSYLNSIAKINFKNVRKFEDKK